MKPLNYKDYTVHDFVKDELFIKWVLKPDLESDHFWQKWLENNPDKAQVLETARRFIEQLHFQHSFEIGNDQYTRILEQIMRYKWQEDIAQQDKWRTKIRIIWWSLAATLLIIVTSIAILNYMSATNQEISATQHYIVKKIPAGSKYSLRLPDGSKVQLNACSELRYPQQFDGDMREVYLNGEAFFEVEKDSTKPFLIHTGDLLTRVVGTSFNIRAYQNEVVKKIAVVTGIVRITSQHGVSIMVEPETMAIYKNDDESIKTQVYNANEEIGWKDGLLYFNKSALGFVFQQLESWYGVQISVSDDISKDEKYSGEFHNETLDNVLEGIAYTSGFQFKIDGKHVMIFKPKSNSK